MLLSATLNVTNNISIKYKINIKVKINWFWFYKKKIRKFLEFVFFAHFYLFFFFTFFPLSASVSVWRILGLIFLPFCNIFASLLFEYPSIFVFTDWLHSLPIILFTSVRWCIRMASTWFYLWKRRMNGLRQ